MKIINRLLYLLSSVAMLFVYTVGYMIIGWMEWWEMVSKEEEISTEIFDKYDY